MIIPTLKRGLGSRFTSKLVLLVGVIVLQFLFLNYLYHFISHSNLYGTISSPASAVLGAGTSLIELDSDMATTNHYLLIQKLLNSDTQTSQSEMCSAYLDGLDEKFTLYPEALISGSYEPSLDYLSSHQYFDKEYQLIKAEYTKAGKDMKEINTKELLKKVNKQILDNKLYKASLINSVGLLRWYSHCKPLITSHDKCTDLEAKLFPWFTFELPTFTRWDGTELKKFPHIEVINDPGRPSEGTSPDIKLHDHDHSESGVYSCFWSSFHDNYDGRGIVVPVNADFEMDQLSRLIKLLRWFGNKLPIQVVYNSRFYKPKAELLDVITQVSRDTIKMNNGDKISNFKQEVWYVDTELLFDHNFHQELLNTSPILVPLLFSSFKEVLFLSPSTFIFKDLASLFEQQSYRDTGLFMFRSKLTNVKLKENFYALIKSMFPSDFEASVLPNVAKLIRLPLDSKYLQPDNSVQMTDSRLFVIDKALKLDALLTLLYLKFTTKIHDSELLWLGLQLHGYDFSYNDLQPGAVGSVLRDDMDKPIVLSKQNVHFSLTGEQELLWMSDAVYMCGDLNGVDVEHEFNELIKDRTRPPQLGDIKSAADLRNAYLQRISFDAVIIPPEYDSGSEVAESWVLTPYCKGTIYKLKKEVQLEGSETPLVGKLIKFDSHQVHSYNLLLDLWKN